MTSLFTRKTFQYFDLAKKNKFRKGWFEKNKDLYEGAVKEPMSLLIREIDERFAFKLPGIVISPRKISRPLRPLAKAKEHGYVKAGAMFFLSEKTTSQFEWNPGLYLHLGDEKEDNIIGMGLYMPSSRQIKRLRSAFVKDYKVLDRILADRKFKKYWKKSLANEKYVRFPKDYSQDDPAAKYLWYKQLFVSRHFKRTEVTSKAFPELVLNSFEAGIPLLAWIRDSVGIFNRREYEREKLERMAEL
ncbi:MAG TPA: DUF2461 family protein [Bdellovibrionota bacterium]|jgi:uncharacterized protein (TIGR02453 family)